MGVLTAEKTRVPERRPLRFGSGRFIQEKSSPRARMFMVTTASLSGSDSTVSSFAQGDKSVYTAPGGRTGGGFCFCDGTDHLAS